MHSVNKSLMRLAVVEDAFSSVRFDWLELSSAVSPCFFLESFCEYVTATVRKSGQ